MFSSLKSPPNITYVRVNAESLNCMQLRPRSHLTDLLLAAVASENFPICMFHHRYFDLSSQIKEDEVFYIFISPRKLHLGQNKLEMNAAFPLCHDCKQLTKRLSFLTEALKMTWQALGAHIDDFAKEFLRNGESIHLEIFIFGAVRGRPDHKIRHRSLHDPYWLHC